jgi:hypothetical protein
MSINGFEILTAELSHYEQEVLLPKIVAGLATKKGKELAITNKKICKGMKERGMTITEVRVRKLVNYIRTHDLLPGLIAHLQVIMLQKILLNWQNILIH